MIIKHNEQKGLDVKEIFKNNKFPLIKLVAFGIIVNFFNFNSMWINNLYFVKIYYK